MTGLSVRALRTRHLGPFDLEVKAAETVCLSGPSGSGKTLILRAIADLDPHEGSIMLDNQAQLEFLPSNWRRQVAYLASESGWWSDKVGDHFVQQDQPWLEPLGFNRECFSWEISRLSSGERQRLALARALAYTPSFLLLDEPTATLDMENTGQAESIVSTSQKKFGSGVIWVSHDPEQRRRLAQRSYVLQGSLLTEEF